MENNFWWSFMDLEEAEKSCYRRKYKRLRKCYK
ncbi:Uncharacterised protein [Clostridioides difficile]|uniref:Uncharacterized protein n=1 Tax=Clostridioides difficile TaxID=1496 RepID=A0A9X8WQI7_CLODI|nr:Uncharacterised protein [Clostridioides difficile]SJS01149.1 Uncharacterised protein [Clostridioides difficile]SJS39397.1 Uncharacterised protein [Clostridioides difficile]SJS63615.1 Uncharacterised protein [Clostridioides difficile]SJX17645.1 Uncharacterised protein [Clostridioides difficile]